MNEEEFALLVEHYLDGALPPEERRALLTAVQTSPQWRQAFEDQVRQHVRLHAHIAPCGLAEAQRIATLVAEIVARNHEPEPAPLFPEPTLRQRLRAIFDGLRAPADSGAYRYARFTLMRILGPAAAAGAVAALVIALLLTLPITPFRSRTDKDLADSTVVWLRPTDTTADEVPERTVTEAADFATAAENALAEQAVAAKAAESLPPSPAAADGMLADAGARKEGVRSRTAGLPEREIRERASLALGEGRGAGAGPRADAAAHAETAVIKALRWLQARQRDDGSWPGQEPVALSSLALLAFLGRGAVPATSAEFGPTVERALKYLLSRQDQTGCFSRNAYAHGIATYAVSEAYGQARVVALGEAMERAANAIVEAQQPGGGFASDYAVRNRFDPAVTVWQIQALHAAKRAGSKHPRLDETIQRSVALLKSEAFVRDERDLFPESAGIGPPKDMTGIGLLCLRLLDEGAPIPALARAKTAAAGERGLTVAATPPPATTRAGGAGHDAVKATGESSKRTPRKWNERTFRELIQRQQPDGHWEGGDWDRGSDVYTTALCTLMLEAHYRQLPAHIRFDESSTADPSRTEVPVHVR